jgi:hypothetical protein
LIAYLLAGAVAIALALAAGLVFGSALIFAIALPPMAVVTGLFALFYNLHQRRPELVDRELRRAAALVRAGRPDHARLYIDRAIQSCKVCPDWDGTGATHCRRLAAWRDDNLPG